MLRSFSEQIRQTAPGTNPSMLRFSSSVPLAGVALAAALAASEGRGAVPSYDGRWSVEIAPEGGDCEGMYVLPLQVAGGKVTYVGRAAVTAEGGIGADGIVRVVFVIESDRLDAKGRMSNERFGAGSWTSPTGNCRGTWIARKGR